MVKLEGIRKIFAKGTIDEKLAIDRISLHIKKGDFLTIIGSNGAGKTTLLNLTSGTFFPDEGEVFISGSQVTQLAEHRRSKYLGRIFQNPLMGTASSMTI